MTSLNSTHSGGFFTGLVTLIIAVVLIGAVGGLLVSNLPVQMAEADRLRLEAESETRTREQVDLPYLEAERALEHEQYQAMIERAIAQEAEALRVDRLRHDQRLRTEAMLHGTAVFILLLVATSVIVVLTAILGRFGWQWAEQVQRRQPEQPFRDDRWQDEAFRRHRRESACREERRSRQLAQALNGNSTNGAPPHHRD